APINLAPESPTVTVNDSRSLPTPAHLTARTGMDTDRGQCWARVTALPQYLQRQSILSPWQSGPQDLFAPFRADADDFLAIEVWEAGTIQRDGGRGLPPYPDISLVRRSDPYNGYELAHLFPNPRCRGRRAFGAGFCNTERCLYPTEPARFLPCVQSD